MLLLLQRQKRQRHCCEVHVSCSRHSIRAFSVCGSCLLWRSARRGNHLGPLCNPAAPKKGRAQLRWAPPTKMESAMTKTDDQLAVTIGRPFAAREPRKASPQLVEVRVGGRLPLTSWPEEPFARTSTQLSGDI